MDLKFSAIISVYQNDNSEFFRQAVNSLLNQTVKADEIIITVDGPVGKKLTSVIDFFEKRSGIRVIRLPENVGRGKSRDISIRSARYNFVALMDADDISTEKRFEKEIDLHRKLKVDVVGSYIEEFKEQPGDKKALRKVPVTHKAIVKYGKWRQPMNHQTIFFRKKAYLKVDGYRSLKMLEDFDIFHRMIIQDVIFANIPEVLVYARFSEEQHYRRSGLAYFKEEFQVLREMFYSGYLNFFQFFANSLIRFFARISPVIFLNKLYKNLLRN